MFHDSRARMGICLALVLFLQAIANVAAAQEAGWSGRRSTRSAAGDASPSSEKSADVIEEFGISPKDKFIFVPVVFDGQEQLFVVDTGFTACAVDTSLRSKLKPTGRTGMLNGKLKIDIFRLPEAHIGTIRIPRGAEASCHDLTWLRLFSGRDIRGIVGMNVLASRALRIDFDAGKLSFLRQATRRAGEAELPLSYSSQNTPVLDTAYFTGVVRRFMIDTGWSGDGQLEQSAFNLLLEKGEVVNVRSNLSLMPGRLRLARTASVKPVPTGRSQPIPLRVGEGPSNVLGFGVLSRYIITFDFPNDRMFVGRGRRVRESAPAGNPVWSLEFDKELADANEAVQLDPDSADAHVALARMWAKRKCWERAFTACSTAIRLDPKMAATFDLRASIRYSQGEYEEAVGDYDEAVRLDPTNARRYRDLGAARHRRAEYDKAVAAYDRSIRLDPSDATTFCDRGLAREERNDCLGAVADWNEALRLDANNTKAQMSLAWIYATCWNDSVRDGKRAVELTTKLCEMSGWSHAGCLWTLAAAYAETGDYSNAIMYEEQALEYADETEKPFCDYCLDLFKSGTPYHAKRLTQAELLILTDSPSDDP